MQYDDLQGVRVRTAADILGYDPSTVRRKARAGDLESYGSGQGLRITLRSIKAYQAGERGKWRKSEQPSEPTTATVLRVIPKAKPKPGKEPRKEDGWEELTAAAPSWFKGV